MGASPAISARYEKNLPHSLKISKLFFARQESQGPFSERARMYESHSTLDIGGAGFLPIRFSLS